MALSRAARGVVGALLALLVVAGGVVAYAAWSVSGVAGRGDPVTIDIPGGATAATVARQLESAGVVRWALAFQLKARSRDLDRRLQAGSYQLETGMSVDEAIERLLDGPRAPESVRFTIPEGLTVDQTIARLAQQTPHRAADYRQVLDAGRLDLPDWVRDLRSLGAAVPSAYEGLLFPETYEARKDAPPQAVLQRMVDQLAAVFRSVPPPLVGDAARQGLDRYEVLIVASLIEEEARIPAERPAVAGVIMNRLRAGMALQIDASNLYAAGQKRRVTGTIRNIDSPYNLYTRAGLPPTPISSPGRAAILAAFDPDEHEFLYYAKVDESGRHAFARTLAEHQRNVQRLRDLQRRAAVPRPATPSSPAPTSPPP